MASTVGKEIVDRIVDEINNNNASFGVVLDAVASETADAALDWMLILLTNDKKRREETYQNEIQSRLWRPPFVNQKLIYDVLNLERLGISITERFMLVPEKSVIAIAGVEGVGCNE